MQQYLNSRIPKLALSTLQASDSFFSPHSERKSYMLFYLMIFDLLEETCSLNPGGISNFINVLVEKSKSYKSNVD